MGVILCWFESSPGHNKTKKNPPLAGFFVNELGSQPKRSRLGCVKGREKLGLNDQALGLHNRFTR